MKSISTEAIFTGFRSKADRSLGFSGVTPELTNEQKALFFDLQNINVNLIIIPTDEPNSPEYKVDKKINVKSQSQRIRAVLFVLWKKEGEIGDFEAFYHNEMEKLIELLKQRIDEPTF